MIQELQCGVYGFVYARAVELKHERYWSGFLFGLRYVTHRHSRALLAGIQKPYQVPMAKLDARQKHSGMTWP